VSAREPGLVEKSLWAAAWARSHAERGDYEYALRWIDVARDAAGGLSPAQRQDRARWMTELLYEQAELTGQAP
jgi:hypothetical protein